MKSYYPQLSPPPPPTLPNSKLSLYPQLALPKYCSVTGYVK
jgi:hypothetical protein